MSKLPFSWIPYVFLSLLFFYGCGKTDSAQDVPAKFSATPLITGKPSNIGGTCALDMINGVVTKSATVLKVEPVTVGGWAVDSAGGIIPEYVIVRLSNADGSQVFYAATSNRVSRPDVATALKNPSLEKSGFNLTATLEAVPSGQYTLELLQPTAKALLVCSDKGQIIVQ